MFNKQCTAEVSQLNCFLFSTPLSTRPSQVKFVLCPILQLPHLEFISKKMFSNVKTTQGNVGDMYIKTV